MSTQSNAEIFDQILSERYSCRAYLDKAVPKDIIEKIFATAQKTASWSNMQPWEVTIVSGDALRKFGAVLQGDVAGNEASPDFPFPTSYEGVYQDRRRACGLQLYKSVGIGREDKAQAKAQMMANFDGFGAPHMAIVTSVADFGTYGAIDCGGFVSSVLSVARSHGVATIAQAAMARNSGFVKDHLGIDPGRNVVCGISFGYEYPDHVANKFRTPRAALDDVITWVE